MPSWRKLIVSGSDASLNSLVVANGITGSLQGTASYALDADLLDGKDSSTFATTGSNTFIGSQTIDGNLFMSGSNRLIYNNSTTNAMLFGFFDGSSIYGPYYQIFGNQYADTTQRGSAEFVYDTRNGGGSGFNIASFNGVTWIRKFRVDDNGAQVTGSLNVTEGITGSLYGTASWAEKTLTASLADTASNLIGGTNNYIAVWTGSTALTGSIIYQSGSSLGIGTTTPTFVVGTGVEVKGNTDTNIRIVASTNTGFDLVQAADATAYIYNRDNAPLVFGTNNGEDLRIAADGKTIVNSSTSFGNYQFQVNGATYINGSTEISGSLDVTGSVRLPGLSNAVQSSVVGFDSATGQLFYQSSGSLSVGTASFVTASDVHGPFGRSSILSASFAVSSSQAQNAVTASYVLNAKSASFATTASFAQNALSASFASTASYSTNFTVANQLTIDSTLTDYATVASSIVGSNNLFTQATGSYTSAFFKYSVTSGSNTRAGEVIAAWNDTSVQYYDNSTVDIGTTTVVTSSVAIVGSNVEFNVQTNTGEWKIKSLATFM